MNLFQFLVLLLIAGVCGSIGQSLAGFSRGGCLASIALGFIGALLGSWLARTAGLPAFFTISIGGDPFPVLWSIVGSALFVAVLGLISGGGRRRD